jgi:outer membrane protein OmpA-like peptidoglycan-associated protein
MKKKLLAALVAMACASVTFAAGDDARQTVSINTPNPSVEEVEAALFPVELTKQKDECAQMEKIGLRCQSVIPKSALDTIQITFGRGSASLSDEAKGFLRSVGGALQRKMGVWKSLVIEGHTDKTGSEASNRRLSKERAESVRSFLAAEFGLTNIETVGRSSERLKDEANPSGELNRRIEFVPNW